MTATQQRPTLTHELGSFEGFNHRDQRAIELILSAQEVIDWDHDAQGESEFWPAGDHPGVALIFQAADSVTPFEITALDGLLEELGDETQETFVRLHVLCHLHGHSLRSLQADDVHDLDAHVFSGHSFIDLRRQAAYELFELCYPEEYAVWEKSLCDGLIFDEDRFLDSPVWCTEEVTCGDTKFFVVMPN